MQSKCACQQVLCPTGSLAHGARDLALLFSLENIKIWGVPSERVMGIKGRKKRGKK